MKILSSKPSCVEGKGWVTGKSVYDMCKYVLHRNIFIISPYQPSLILHLSTPQHWVAFQKPVMFKSFVLSQQKDV